MSAIFFLLALVAVLWLGFWTFEEPPDAESSKSRRPAPFDYTDIEPGPTGSAPIPSGARWRQRRARANKQS
jgi:hypothetical protein